ncbi:MAG: hypothetical protein F6K19_15595 [Cyanothece sp. SIO1E1]|nr:hypothetical protein [Cyanothece sp. SIO1E1]
MNPFLVNKCVCHNTSFEDIKKYVEEHQVKTVRELQASDICSTKCQMCEPYVELVIKTGEVEFVPGAYIGRKKSS